MTDPYRHVPGTCPSCGVALRPFGPRLCCDRCEGMLLTVADLARSIDELTHVEPAIAFVHDRAGKLPCPGCATAMTTCRVELAMMDQTIRPKV